MVLLINACARPASRTLPLAIKTAQKLSSDIQTLNLYDEHIVPINYETLSKRENYAAAQDFSDGMFRFARQFKAAENIVIAAPYWDLSFPSVLKCYLEQVCVNGLTFQYNKQGIPVGLCNAEKLVYVTTAGGYIPERNYGFDYIRQLCTDFFGIGSTAYIKAEGLDIFGANADKILTDAENSIRALC